MKYNPLEEDQITVSVKSLNKQMSNAYLTGIRDIINYLEFDVINSDISEEIETNEYIKELLHKIKQSLKK